MSRLLLLIPDGAAGVLGRVHTPAFDRLPHGGWLQTVPDGLPVASEVALPALLGRRLASAPGRGAVEAAAVGEPVDPDESAWRLDLEVAEPRDPAVTADRLSGVLGARVRHLRRGRFLLVGPRRWLRDGRDRVRQRAARATVGCPVRLWGGSANVSWRTLDIPAAVVAAPTGAAAGVARLLGADLVAPSGATGFPGTDLTAKVAATQGLLDAEVHELVVLHVGAADEAGHARDPEGQRACVEAFDRHVVAPVIRRAAASGVAVLVAPDHATDPVTGRHVGGDVNARATFPLAGGPAWHVVPRILVRKEAA